jgi:hypothetical protein
MRLGNSAQSEHHHSRAVSPSSCSCCRWRQPSQQARDPCQRNRWVGCVTGSRATTTHFHSLRNHHAGTQHWLVVFATGADCLPTAGSEALPPPPTPTTPPLPCEPKTGFFHIHPTLPTSCSMQHAPCVDTHSTYHLYPTTAGCAPPIQFTTVCSLKLSLLAMNIKGTFVTSPSPLERGCARVSRVAGNLAHVEWVTAPLNEHPHGQVTALSHRSHASGWRAQDSSFTKLTM